MKNKFLKPLSGLPFFSFLFLIPLGEVYSAPHEETNNTPAKSLYLDEFISIRQAIDAGEKVVLNTYNLNTHPTNLIHDVDFLQPLHSEKKIIENVNAGLLDHHISKSVNARNVQFNKEGQQKLRIDYIDNITLGSEIIKNVKCIIVDEVFSLHDTKNKVPEYQYTNKYIYVYDALTDQYIGATFYIQRVSGFLMTEHKIFDINTAYYTANNIPYKKEHNIAYSNIPLEDALLITPNPASNKVNLSYFIQNESNVIIQIVDVNGRVVKKVIENTSTSKGYHNINVNISDIPKGSYFVKFQSNQKVTTETLSVL